MEVRRTRSVLVGAACLALLASTAWPVQAQWTQWGGPNQDFTVDSQGIADSWPEDGPKKLWTRELGDGYSAILSDGGSLYTMYRNEDQEIVICLDPESGKTVWEHSYKAPLKPGHMSQFGEGPRSTPLIVGDHIYTAGVSGQLHCLIKKTGKPVWSHSLWDEFNGSFLNHGYSSSPFAYKNTIIVLNGGDDNAMIAFNQKDGKVAWKKNGFTNSYSTPRLIDVDGQPQLLCYMGEELVSINPDNGDVYWTHEISNDWKQNVNQPIFDTADNMLLLSSAMAGSVGLKLTRDGDTCKAEKIWSTKKVQFYHVTSVGLGEWVYGSSGSPMGQASLFSCINRKTGEIGWRVRGLAKACTIYADGKFIILDEDGKLALARANPEEFEILSKANICDKVAWTVPTLVGTTLFVRDKKNISAFDLSHSS